MARSANGSGLKQLNHSGMKWDDSGKNGYHRITTEVCPDRRGDSLYLKVTVTGVDAQQTPHPRLCVYSGVSDMT